MATYVNNTWTTMAAGAVNGVRSFNTPASAASGDRLITMVRVAQPDAGGNPSISSLPSGSTTHTYQELDDPDAAYFIVGMPFSFLHDGASSSYSVTISDASTTTLGGSITCVAYTGDVDVTDEQLLIDSSSGTAQAGPSQVIGSGETCVAFFLGNDIVVTTTWDSPFTERTDNEYDGHVTVADSSSTGTLAPTATTTAAEPGMWWLFRLGTTVTTNNPLRTVRSGLRW